MLWTLALRSAHLYGGFIARLAQVFVFHHFGHNEALLEVGVDTSSGLWCLCAFLRVYDFILSMSK